MQLLVFFCLSLSHRHRYPFADDGPWMEGPSHFMAFIHFISTSLLFLFYFLSFHFFFNKLNLFIRLNSTVFTDISIENIICWPQKKKTNCHLNASMFFHLCSLLVEKRNTHIYRIFLLASLLYLLFFFLLLRRI